MNKNKKTLIYALSSLVAVSIIVLSLLISDVVSIRPTEQPVEPEVIPEVVPEENPELVKLKEEWQANKAINEDYVGDIIFDSGLLRVNFVQATSVYKNNGEMYKFYTENGNLVTDPTGYSGNDVYIWTYWKTGEYDYNDNGGSTFMDYRNYLTDDNLIIYGHHFSEWNDETRTKAFTPLEKFLDKENYEDNKYVTLVLGDEIRKYEVAVVYNFDATQDIYYSDAQYWRTDYSYDDYTNTVDNDYYQRYIDFIKSVELYDTGVDLTTEDKTVTLQTCISGRVGELFEILVLKEIERFSY